MSKFKKPKTELHHQSEPVPGIYMHDAEGQYLVAMKPKSSRGYDSALFATRTGFDSPCGSLSPSALRPSMLPRRESTISMMTVSSSFSTDSSKSSVEKPQSGSITPTDFGGYRALRHPHYIEWNNVHGRYMFSEEVSLRTIIVDMCSTKACRNSPTKCDCNKTVKQKLFLLDDDFSYVLAKGDLTRRHAKSRLVEGAHLWCFGRESGALRRQTPEEAAVNIHRMSTMEHKFLCESDKPSYMKVVKYAKRKNSY